MTVKLVAAIALLLSACSLLAAAEQVVQVPKPSQVLSTLVEGHPRLVLNDRRFKELKRLAGTDKLLAKGVRDVLAQADRAARRPVLVRKLIGPRLLSVSRACVDRMYTLGFAWRWTGKQRYADKARENLLAVCRFQDWNPRHFLDTAEMSHAVGVGYDWFYPALDEPTRQAIRQGLIRCGMEPGVRAYRGRGAGWTRTAFNWNQVCNSGLTIGALAIADTDPNYAKAILPKAVASLPRALATYGPDGAWPEGPGYWGYATRYTVYGLAALETALGTDFGLSKVKGLSQAGYFPIYAAGPTGYFFNFADVGMRSRLSNRPSLFWLARRYRNPFFAAAERKLMAAGRARTTDVIWYVPPSDAKVPEASLAKRFRGPVEVALFRAAWGDPNALFAAVKAGYNQVNHGHLDLGTFEMDALGVRWVRDLGADNYNLPSYWGRSADAQRWKYYRLGSRSHSIPLLDDRNQDVRAVAKMTHFQADGPNGLAVVDLGQAYKPLASKAVRGLKMIRGLAVLIQDELELTRPCEAAWGLTTAAKIAPGGDRATLTLDGRTLTARVLSPAGAAFRVESAEQKPPQATNRGFRRLMLRVKADKGPIRFAVLLSPAWPDGQSVGSAQIVPLDRWK